MSHVKGRVWRPFPWESSGSSRKDDIQWVFSLVDVSVAMTGVQYFDVAGWVTEDLL